MHITAKKLTILGMLLALATVLLLLGSYFESSTLFFLAASSFCLGAAIYETNLRLGAAYLIAAVLLAFLLSPNIFHCFTYGGFCLYVYFLELIRRKQYFTEHSFVCRLIKLIFYNGCFVAPALYFFPQYLFSSTIQWSPRTYVFIVVNAQLPLILFDLAYSRFIPGYWIHLKQRFRLDA